MLPRQRHEVLVEFPAGEQRGRVGREVHDQRRRLRHRMPHGAVDRLQHRVIRRVGDGTGGGAGDDEAELVDRVGWVGHQDRVARGGDRLRQIGQPFLGAEGGDHLRLRVQRHAEAAGVIAGQRLPQAGDALRHRIAMGARVLHRLHQLGDDVRRRRAIGVAHAEIDDVLAHATGLGLGAVHLGEDVGRQAPDTVELLGHRPGSV